MGSGWRSESRDGPIQIVPTGGQGPAFSLGHGRGYFAALAFSPDSAYIASVDGRKLVIWDLAKRQELLTLSGHKEEITAIAFSPDGSLVATSCGDSMTRIWDARDGRAMAVLPGPWYMRKVAFSPDGEYLAASADPGPVCLYQLKGQREQRRLVGHKFIAHSLAFHPRLAQLASASDDHTVIVWHAGSARPVWRLPDCAAGTDGLAYSPDGSLLAIGAGSGGGQYRPGDIQLCDAENGSVRRVLSGHMGGVRALAFDPTSRRLATADTTGIVIIWDVTTGQIVRRQTETPWDVLSIAFVDEGRRLVTRAQKGSIVLYDVQGTEPGRDVAVTGGIHGFVVDPARNDLILAETDGGLCRVSLPDFGTVHRLEKAHDGMIVSLALSRDGRLLASSGMDRRVVLRDAMTFEVLLTFPGWTGVVRDLAFDASDRWLAFAGSDTDVCLWDIKMVHAELVNLGLAWDDPAQAVTSSRVGRAPVLSYGHH